MGFGPDNNKPSVLDNQVGVVDVPHGKRAEFKFSSNASFENAVCIYPQFGDTKIHEAGNFNRSLATFSTPENNSGHVQQFKVTGWHKPGRPSGSLPWLQSSMKIIQNDLSKRRFGFEDQGGEDYDDIMVTVDIVD